MLPGCSTHGYILHGVVFSISNVNYGIVFEIFAQGLDSQQSQYAYSKVALTGCNPVRVHKTLNALVKRPSYTH